jgi:Flp pilus assembly pilin Flp
MKRKHKGQDEQGQAIVEFALLFTFLTLLVMGVLGFGLILTTQISLVSTAKVACRKATIRSMHTEYCSRQSSDHYNSPIYDTVINSLGGLPVENIEGIVIFEASDEGQIIEENMDILDANGDLVVSAFSNGERCRDDIYIGIEIRYNQEVPVPFINWITGDVMVLPARIIMHIE